MTELDLYKAETQTDGISKKTLRYRADINDVVHSGAMGIVGVITAVMGSSLCGLDPVTGAAVSAVAGAGLGTSFYKSFAYAEIKDSLKQLSNGLIDRPKFSQTRRSWKEKRVLILENALSDDRKNKVTRELVTNRRGIWVEETIVPIATTAVQVKSWDTVLDSIIKVHGLENLDKIASKTIPALSNDGKKLSWRTTAGNILGELGVLQECTKRNCPRDCNHFF